MLSPACGQCRPRSLLPGAHGLLSRPQGLCCGVECGFVFLPPLRLFLQLGTALLNTGHGPDVITAHRSDVMGVCVSILDFLFSSFLKGPPLERRLSIWHPPAGF